MNKAGLLSAVTLALGAIVGGIYYTSEQVNLEVNRAYLEYRGLTQEEGGLFQEFVSEYEMPENVKSFSYSFLTYDSKDPSYDLNDSQTWTQDIWLGNFYVDVLTNDLKAMEVINQIAADLEEAFPSKSVWERKPHGLTAEDIE